MRLSGLFQAICSKVAALAILAAIIGGGAVGIALPVWQKVRELDGQIIEQRNLLGRYREIVASANTTSADKSGDIEAEMAATFLPGESDALRLASLQSTLNDAVAAQKIRLASAQTIDAPEQGGLRLLSLQAQLSTELEPLQKLLFNLERQQPNLIVDGLHIARAPDGGGARVPGLDVSFALRGAAANKKE